MGCVRALVANVVLALMHSPENKAPARQVMDAKPFFCRNVGRLDVVTTEIATVLEDLGHIVVCLDLTQALERILILSAHCSASAGRRYAFPPPSIAHTRASHSLAQASRSSARIASTIRKKSSSSIFAAS